MAVCICVHRETSRVIEVLLFSLDVLVVEEGG